MRACNIWTFSGMIKTNVLTGSLTFFLSMFLFPFSLNSNARVILLSNFDSLERRIRLKRKEDKLVLALKRRIPIYVKVQAEDLLLLHFVLSSSKNAHNCQLFSSFNPVEESHGQRIKKIKNKRRKVKKSRRLLHLSFLVPEFCLSLKRYQLSTCFFSQLQSFALTFLV